MCVCWFVFVTRDDLIKKKRYYRIDKDDIFDIYTGSHPKVLCRNCCEDKLNARFYIKNSPAEYFLYQKNVFWKVLSVWKFLWKIGYPLAFLIQFSHIYQCHIITQICFHIYENNWIGLCGRHPNPSSLKNDFLRMKCPLDEFAKLKM